MRSDVVILTAEDDDGHFLLIKKKTTKYNFAIYSVIYKLVFAFDFLVVFNPCNPRNPRIN